MCRRGQAGPGEDDHTEDDVDWIDAGPDDPMLDTVETRPGRARRRWPYLAAAALLLVGLVVVRVESSRTHASAVDPPTPTARPASSAPKPAPPISFPPSVDVPLPLISISDLGHPILSAPAGWNLFGLGAGYVVRIQLALGRATRTVIPQLDSSGLVSFLAGPSQAVIRPLDVVTGYQVRDGAIASPLPPGLRIGGPALPGPQPGQLWVPAEDAQHTKMILIGFDGLPLGPSVIEPGEVGFVSSDGAGYLLFSDVGGVYDARPTGTRRITTGLLLAVGPTRWLSDECDENFHCQTIVTNRITGAKRALHVPTGSFQPFDGAVSPDGNTAAMLQSDSNGHATLHLLDLNTGDDARTRVTLEQPDFPGPTTMVWAPDSRTLFIVNSSGTPMLVDRSTGVAKSMGLTLPPLNQLALRAG